MSVYAMYHNPPVLLLIPSLRMHVLPSTPSGQQAGNLGGYRSPSTGGNHAPVLQLPSPTCRGCESSCIEVPQQYQRLFPTLFLVSWRFGQYVEGGWGGWGVPRIAILLACRDNAIMSFKTVGIIHLDADCHAVKVVQVRVTVACCAKKTLLLLLSGDGCRRGGGRGRQGGPTHGMHFSPGSSGCLVLPLDFRLLRLFHM